LVAVGVLAALTALSLCGAVLMVHHQTRPAVRRATLSERARHTRAVAATHTRPILGGAAGVCLAIAVIAAGRADAPGRTTPIADLAAAPTAQPVAVDPVAPAAAPAVVTTPPAVAPSEPVRATSPTVAGAGPVATVAPTAEVASSPDTSVPEPTTTTTFYTPPPSTGSPVPAPAPVTAAAAAPANPWLSAWSQWFGLWYQMATLGKG
jgi:hypothetical protein